MKRKYKIDDTYDVIVEDVENMSEKDIKRAIKDAIAIIKRKELKVKDAEPRLINEEGKIIEKGDEVTSFRGEKAIVKGWSAPQFQGKSGRVHVSWVGNDDEMSSMSYYPEVFGLKWSNKEDEVEDIMIKDMFEPISSFKSFEFLTKNARGDKVVKAYEDLRDNRMHVIVHRNGLDDYVVGLGYNPDDGTWNQGRYDFSSFENAEKYLTENYKVKEFVKDVKVEDVPVNAPKEEVNITYTEKLKGGKDALTYGMIETAFKNRARDDGKTFRAYVDVAIKSLKDDIANAKDIVSGEMDSTRKLLLEDYVKIERLIRKAGLEEKAAEIQPLIDELSEKLDLDTWRQPKFKKKSAAKELRGKHRWDSIPKGEQIAKVFEQEFAGCCGPFGNENPIRKGNKLTLHSQGPDETWIFNDDGSVDMDITPDEFVKSVDKDDYGCETEEELREYFETIKHFDNVEDLVYSDLSWFMDIDNAKILEKVDKILKGIYDSNISKSMKPIFLCTKNELISSYKDAKQGKLPEVFEANLEKVRKDMQADYDRINNGRDTYVEDPRIAKTLPEIIDLYNTALQYANDLEYTVYAKEFEKMLETIKRAWGLAGL